MNESLRSTTVDLMNSSKTESEFSPDGAGFLHPRVGTDRHKINKPSLNEHNIYTAYVDSL